jgi:hypothetical protein
MDITRQLRGKTVDMVMTNGYVLSFRMSDGAVIDIIQVDDNGRPLKGRFLVQNHGWKLNCKEITHMANEGLKNGLVR